MQCTDERPGKREIKMLHCINKLRVDKKTHTSSATRPCKCRYSRASVFETLLTAQPRLVLQTATYRRQKRKTHADRHENIDAMKWCLDAAALKTPTRNGYNAQGIHLTSTR